MNDDDLSYILHLFEDEHQHDWGGSLTKVWMTSLLKAYSQLPTNMRVNIYSDTPDYDIPDWARRGYIVRDQ
jgi:hypothetical protein